jgi:hypothetical protein
MGMIKSVADPNAPELQKITQQGAPDWASAGPIPTVMGTDSDGLHSGDDAYVRPGISKINVMQPGNYTPAVAAHEATHVFQGTRNGDFQRRTNGLLSGGDPRPSDYDYGGVAGLQAHPGRTISNYNPEQQAQMVEDLTSAQDALPAHMSQQQLAAWDAKKNALERPIQQLTRIPAADTSLLGRADEYLDARPELGLDHPFARLKGLISPPAMPTAPEPGPGAPSVALGYANRSRLVK